MADRTWSLFWRLPQLPTHAFSRSLATLARPSKPHALRTELPGRVIRSGDAMLPTSMARGTLDLEGQQKPKTS